MESATNNLFTGTLAEVRWQCREGRIPLPVEVRVSFGNRESEFLFDPVTFVTDTTKSAIRVNRCLPNKVRQTVLSLNSRVFTWTEQVRDLLCHVVVFAWSRALRNRRTPLPSSYVCHFPSFVTTEPVRIQLDTEGCLVVDDGHSMLADVLQHAKHWQIHKSLWGQSFQGVLRESSGQIPVVWSRYTLDQSINTSIKIIDEIGPPRIFHRLGPVTLVGTTMIGGVSYKATGEPELVQTVQALAHNLRQGWCPEGSPELLTLLSESRTATAAAIPRRFFFGIIVPLDDRLSYTATHAVLFMTSPYLSISWGSSLLHEELPLPDVFQTAASFHDLGMPYGLAPLSPGQTLTVRSTSLGVSIPFRLPEDTEQK